jgi:hypothetical protein
MSLIATSSRLPFLWKRLATRYRPILAFISRLRRPASSATMVTLTEVQRSNAQISTAVQPLVGVFVGATSGIGEYALREFVRHGGDARVYFVGRSQEAGDRLTAEMKSLNEKAHIKFVKADVSLMKTVDEVSLRIREQEKYINVLFQSQGTAQFRTSKLRRCLDFEAVFEEAR